MTEEQWIYHLRKLSKSNAELHVKVRSLRLEVTALKDDNLHYQQEFVRQNAKMLELGIRMEVKDGSRSYPTVAEIPQEHQNPKSTGSSSKRP